MSLTNFPNGVTSFGIPQLSDGQIPVKGRHTSNYYFVDGLNGADGNDGETPEEAFATIEKAITVVNNRINWSNSPWGTGDVIIIAPGVYAENLTALPYGASIVGLGNSNDNSGDNGVTIKPASGSPVDVTSVINLYIGNIKFESADTSDCFEVDEMNSSVIENCYFEGVAGATATTLIGLDVVKKGTNNKIIGNTFNHFIQGIYLGYTEGGDQFAYSTIQGNHFLTQKTNGIWIHANQVCSGLHIVSNYITCTDGSSIGIDDNSDTAHIIDNYIYSPNDAIQGGLETNGNYANGSVE